MKKYEFKYLTKFDRTQTQRVDTFVFKHAQIHTKTFMDHCTNKRNELENSKQSDIPNLHFRI